MEIQKVTVNVHIYPKSSKKLAALLPKSCKYTVGHVQDPKSESEFGFKKGICEMNLLNPLVPTYRHK
jgi:hypothetical protein